jgi:hypothetical protein
MTSGCLRDFRKTEKQAIRLSSYSPYSLTEVLSNTGWPNSRCRAWRELLLLFPATLDNRERRIEELFVHRLSFVGMNGCNHDQDGCSYTSQHTQCYIACNIPGV